MLAATRSIYEFFVCDVNTQARVRGDLTRAELQTECFVPF